MVGYGPAVSVSVTVQEEEELPVEVESVEEDVESVVPLPAVVSCSFPQEATASGATAAGNGYGKKRGAAGFRISAPRCG